MFEKIISRIIPRLFILLIALPLTFMQANTVSQMRLPTVEEWIFANPNETIDISGELQAYHDTGPFTQTIEEFKADPYVYFKKRLFALDNLMTRLASEKVNHPSLQLLFNRAQLKKEYLLQLPDPLSRYVIKNNVFDTERSIPMRNFFSMERFDPLHRFGDESYHYLTEWEASNVPNYFIFLETIETDRRHRAFAPFRHYVAYYNDDERAQHEAAFKQQMIFWKDKPLNSALDNKNEKIRFLYILGPDGKFYINEHKMFRLHHSSEFQGQNLLGVGEIVATNGKIELINNCSGHYTPHQKEIFPALEFLNSHYGDLSEAKLSLICADVSSTLTYNAQEYLDTKGHCAALHGLDTWTPLHQAIYLQQWDIAKKLREKYEDAVKDPKACNPWKIVYDAKDPVGYQFLLDIGIDPLPGSEHCNPFMWIARDGDVDLFDFLFNAVPKEKQKALLVHDSLFNTAAGRSIPMIENLIKKGFDFSRNTIENLNVMHFAAASGVDMLKYFEKKGFGYMLYAHDDCGVTPIMMAVKHGPIESIKYLLSKGLSINGIDSSGNTPLHLAIESENFVNVRWLLSRPEAKTFINRKNNLGLTPLHTGISVLPVSLYQKLLSLADNIDVQDITGLTPYAYVASNNLFSKKAKANTILLLEAGANPEEPDHFGMQPWQFLVRNKQNSALVHLFVHYKGELKALIQAVKQEAKNQNINLKLRI